jgi:O-antigen ligase
VINKESRSRPRAQQRSRRLYRSWFGPAVFALFLQAGAFKRSLPFEDPDVTVVLALLVVMVVWRELARAEFRLPYQILVVFASFLMVAPAALWSTYTPYGSHKIVALFSLGLLAALAALFLLRSAHQLRQFLWTLTLIAAVLAVKAVLFPERPLDVYGRLASDVSGPIALGQIVLVAVLWLVILTIRKGVNAFVTVPVVVSLLYVGIATGSRGPLAAGALAIVLTLCLGSTKNRFRNAVVLVAVAAMSWYVLPSAPEYARDRLGALDASGELRFQVWKATIREISRNPFGIGLGDFSVALPQYSVLQYPHNFLLEIALEAGWIAGLGAIVLLGRLLRAAAMDTSSAEGQALFGLAVFFTASAMVSGDIAGNRMLLAVLGAVLVRSHVGRRPPRPWWRGATLPTAQVAHRNSASGLGAGR